MKKENVTDVREIKGSRRICTESSSDPGKMKGWRNRTDAEAPSWHADVIWKSTIRKCLFHKI